MRYVGIISGDAEQAKPIVIGKDTVYIHKNIRKIIDDNSSEHYEYEETQYTLEEYAQKMAEAQMQAEIVAAVF